MVYFVLENLESADYMQPGDVGFKKPKVRFGSIVERLCIYVLHHRLRRSARHVASMPKSLKFSP